MTTPDSAPVQEPTIKTYIEEIDKGVYDLDTPIMVIDHNGTVHYANISAQDSVPNDSGELVGRNILELLPPDIDPRVVFREISRFALNSTRPADQRKQIAPPEYIIQFPEGDKRVIRARARLATSDSQNGDVRHGAFKIQFEDITEQKKNDLKLALIEKLKGLITPDEAINLLSTSLKDVISYTSACITLLDRKTGKLTTNYAWTSDGKVQKFPIPEDASDIASRKTVRQMDEKRGPVCIRSTATDPEWKQPQYTTDIASYLGIPILANEDGQQVVVGYLHINSNAPNTYSEADFSDISLLGSTLNDVMHKAQGIEELKDLASHDAMTGLIRRSHFDRYIKTDLARLRHRKSVLMLDMDHFKEVNDNYGHDTGDAVIRELANAMRRQTRAEDQGIRYGGEEFIILADEAVPSNAMIMARRLMRDMKSKTFSSPDKPDFSKTLSIGLVSLQAAREQGDHAPEIVNDPTLALKQVDQALYLAKHEGGRDCIGVHFIAKPGSDIQPYMATYKNGNTPETELTAQVQLFRFKTDEEKGPNGKSDVTLVRTFTAEYHPNHEAAVEFDAQNIVEIFDENHNKMASVILMPLKDSTSQTEAKLIIWSTNTDVSELISTYGNAWVQFATAAVLPIEIR